MSIQEGMQPGAAHSSNFTSNVTREQTWAALLLAWTAAFSDAIGFLVLHQLGASFMSGNSMAMGVALGQLEWSAVLQRGLPILTFFLGNLLGSLVITQLRRWGIRSPFAVIFALEALCLLAFLLLGTPILQAGIIPSTLLGSFSTCVVLLTLAMGLQTATLQRAGGQSVRTTFITGVLSDWAQALIQYLSRWRQQASQRQQPELMRTSRQQTSSRNPRLLGGLWLCYVAGAICGSVLELHLALFALIFPLCVLAMLIVLDLLRPMQQPEANISQK